jgi:threonine/homoserine/homoserine lactone efflux protein
VIALLVGLALGVVTGLPVGIVNVAIVEAAQAGRAAFARRIGVGGALADSIHAAVAFVGVGRVVTERPEWKLALALVTGAVFAVYATSVVRRRRRKQETADASASRRGVLVGFLLTLPNPGALAAWVAVAAVVWPAIPTTSALVLAAGVGVGSALWFTALARWVSSRSGTSRSTPAPRPSSATPPDNPASEHPESRPASSPR